MMSHCSARSAATSGVCNCAFETAEPTRMFLVAPAARSVFGSPAASAEDQAVAPTAAPSELLRKSLRCNGSLERYLIPAVPRAGTEGCPHRRSHRLVPHGFFMEGR